MFLMQTYVGLFLYLLGAEYLILAHPLWPGWGWGLVLGSVLVWAFLRTGQPALLWGGAPLLGWGIGAAFADILGMEAFKLWGVGAGLWAVARIFAVSEAAYVGVALLLVGGVVGLFEAGVAPWVALVLLFFGGWLLLVRSPEETSARTRDFEARYRALLRWRIEQARAEGRIVTEVLPDALVVALAEDRPDPEELARLLGDRAQAYLDALVEVLGAA